MSQTPLRLETYFFPKVQIEAIPEYVPQDALSEQDVDVTVNVGLLGNEKEPTRFQLMLKIDKITAKSGSLPYRVSLEAVAIMTIDPGLKHPDIKRLVQVNGSSMLYSAARELVLMVTGRGPWGSFQLPTINFHSVIPSLSSAKEKPKGTVSGQSAT